EQLLGVVVLAAKRFEFALKLLVVDSKLPPLRPRIFGHQLTSDSRALLEALRTRCSDLAIDHVGKTAIDVAIQDSLLVVTVLGQALDFLALDSHGTLVLFNAMAIENANFHNRTVGSRRHTHGGVTDVRRLFTED